MSERVRYYQGMYAGDLLIQSTYPRLYLVRYTRMMEQRRVPVRKHVGGHNEDAVRANLIYGDPHGFIVGEIEVEFVMDLTPVYANASGVSA